MSEIKRKVRFILGDSSKLKAAFEFYPSWFFHLSLQELYIGNGAELESHLHSGAVQSPGTRLARAVRMEHGGGTWSGRARTKTWNP